MGKSFKFSLQKIFDFRRSIEDKRAVELSDAQNALKKKQQILNQLNEKKEDIINIKEKKHKQASNINLNQLKIKKDYILQLNKGIENQIKEVRDSNEKVEAKREKLISATRDKKILEKLKIKYYENYRKMKNQKEAKNEDEVAGRIALKTTKKESY